MESLEERNARLTFEEMQRLSLPDDRRSWGDLTEKERGHWRDLTASVEQRYDKQQRMSDVAKALLVGMSSSNPAMHAFSEYLTALLSDHPEAEDLAKKWGAAMAKDEALNVVVCDMNLKTEYLKNDDGSFRYKTSITGYTPAVDVPRLMDHVRLCCFSDVLLTEMLGFKDEVLTRRAQEDMALTIEDEAIESSFVCARCEQNIKVNIEDIGGGQQLKTFECPTHGRRSPRSMKSRPRRVTHPLSVKVDGVEVAKASTVSVSDDVGDPLRDINALRKAEGLPPLRVKQLAPFTRIPLAKSDLQVGYACVDCGAIVTTQIIFGDVNRKEHVTDTRHTCPKCGPRHSGQLKPNQG